MCFPALLKVVINLQYIFPLFFVYSCASQWCLIIRSRSITSASDFPSEKEEHRGTSRIVPTIFFCCCCFFLPFYIPFSSVLWLCQSLSLWMFYSDSRLNSIRETRPATIAASSFSPYFFGVIWGEEAFLLFNLFPIYPSAIFYPLY